MRSPTMSGKPAAQRAVIAVGILGGLGLAVAAYLFVEPEPATTFDTGDGPLIPLTTTPLTQPPPSTTPPPSPSASASASASATPSPSPSGTPTSRPTAQGPAVTPTAHVEAQSRPDGSFDVVETVVFRKPQNWLLVAPPEAAAGGAALASARPRATELRVTTDGRALQVGITRIDHEQDLYLGESVAKVELRYKLAGATVRSSPSASRRALAVLAPLSGASDETLRTTMTIRGAAVKNLYCPLLPPHRRLCAAPNGPMRGMVGSVAAGEAQVMVQLDLPG